MIADKLKYDYQHFGPSLFSEITGYDKIIISDAGYDSIGVEYKDNLLQDFYGYSTKDFTHLKIVYGPNNFFFSYKPEPEVRVRVIGQYTKDKKKKGEWRYYNEFGTLYKTESYLIPWKEEELVTGF